MCVQEGGGRKIVHKVLINQNHLLVSFLETFRNKIQVIKYQNITKIRVQKVV